MQQQKPPPTTSIFCAAAPSDATLLAQWETHLEPLQQSGRITVWSEQHLAAGTDRMQQINDHLDQAQVIVLLLSADFFASDECVALMEQALSGRARVIPLLLRPVDWKTSPLASLACLPSDGEFVTNGKNLDDAFHTCVHDLQRLIGLPQTRKPASASALQNQNRVRMLRRLHLDYDKLMKQSLQGVAWLDLGLASMPDAVQNRVNLLLRVSNRAAQPLPPGTSITQAYDEAGHELLILGEPGTGKSTLLLDLAQQLVERAEQDTTQPLPVILPLSSWAVKRPKLEGWVAEQLAQIYDVPRRLSTQWVREGCILTLLDGLDEMEEEARPACIMAINTYHCEHLMPLVVCSRKTEYETAAERRRLALQGAVIVQPLTSTDVDAYLVQAGNQLTTLHGALKENTALHDLATTPLMLNILILTYQGTSAHGLPDNESLLLQKVWDDYVKRMVERKGNPKRYLLKRTQAFLGWLARRMREHNQTVFYLEHLQADWLHMQQHPGYARLALYVPSILIGFQASLIIQMFFEGFTNLWASLLYGILGGILGKLWCESLLHESPLSPQKRAWHRVWGTLLLTSIVVGLLAGFSMAESQEAVYVFSDSVLSGAVIGFGVFLLQCLFMIPPRHLPPPGKSLVRHWPYLLRCLETGIVFGLTVTLSYWLSIGQDAWLTIAAYNTGRDSWYEIRQSIEVASNGLNRVLSDGFTYGLKYGLISLVVGMAVRTQTTGVRLTEGLQWTGKSLMRSLLSPKHLWWTLALTCLMTTFYGVNNGLIYWFSNDLMNEGLPTITGHSERSEGLIAELGLWFATGQMSDVLSFWISYSLIYWPIIGFIVGVSYWLLVGLLQGVALDRIEDQDRRTTNQGIRQSLRNGVVMGIISGGIMGMTGLLVQTVRDVLLQELGWVLQNGLSQTLSDIWTHQGVDHILSAEQTGSILSTGFSVGVCGGLVMFFSMGGLAVWRHYVIRWLLQHSHTFPWNVPQFLDDATARFLLRRVGGGYSFAHRLLLDHLADAGTDATPSPNASSTQSPHP